MYAKRNVRAFLTHVGEDLPPGSHVARARTETSIPGFRRGILAGYLWKLNPPVYHSPGKPRPFRHPWHSVEYLAAYPDDRPRLSSVLFPSLGETLLSLFCNPSRFFRLVFPDLILGAPSDLFPTNSVLTNPRGASHRFPPIIRVRCILLRTSRFKWSGEFIGYFRRFAPIISRRLGGKCFINLAPSRRRRGTVVLDKVTKLICTATRWIVLYRIVLYTYIPVFFIKTTKSFNLHSAPEAI